MQACTLTQEELMKYNPNKIKRKWGVRGRGKFRSEFLAVQLYHAKTGEPFDASVEHTMGGGESEGKPRCECGSGICINHTDRQNSIINHYVLDMGHSPFPREIKPAELKASNSQIAQMENARLGAKIAQVIQNKGDDKKAK